MKILYLCPYTGEDELVQSAFPDHECVFADHIEDVADNVRGEIEALSVFVDTLVNAALLAQLPNLKFITTRSTGFDHIDLKTAGERNIPVSRVPRYGRETVAEFAFAMMFALARRVQSADLDLEKTSDIDELESYEGFTLAGKTLGVVGTGAIGRHVCTIARGLGMPVLAYDVVQNEELAADPNVTYMELEELVRAADIITIHVPSTPQTHHMFDEKLLALAKPTAYLINTARGDVIDTPALITALREGRLAGAGLDVLEGERALHNEAELFGGAKIDQALWRTLVADHAIIDMQNVIVTPHIAFNTKEAKKEITDTTIGNIKAYVAGTPTNLVSEVKK